MAENWRFCLKTKIPFLALGLVSILLALCLFGLFRTVKALDMVIQDELRGISNACDVVRQAAQSDTSCDYETLTQKFYSSVWADLRALDHIAYRVPLYQDYALNDLERLTKQAYAMVTYYGMSEKVGTVSFYDSTGSRGYELSKPYSENTAELIDREVKDIIGMIHDRTYKILMDNREGFEKLANLLLEKEVIFSDDLERIFGPRANSEAAVPEEDRKPAEIEGDAVSEAVTESETKADE